VHFLADADPQVLGLRLQTQRQRWQGRNRLPESPLAAFDNRPDAARGSVALDTGLDPVAALAVQVCIAPRSKCLVTVATALSHSPEMLRAMIDKYRQPIHVQRALLMSATLTEVRLRSLRLQADHLGAVQTLTTALTFSLSRPMAPFASLEAEGSEFCDRRRLWRFCISGDRPILLVSVAVIEGMGLLLALAQALGLGATTRAVSLERQFLPIGAQRVPACVQRKPPCESAARIEQGALLGDGQGR
jgi:cyclic beta-1,2-glucan synthetase